MDASQQPPDHGRQPDRPEDVAEPRPLTDEELKALAHPLRVRMLEALTSHGTSTASQLAARLGETSGATSYHLRQLARHGFVEEDEGRGTARERWWRVKRRGWSLPSLEFRRREATRHHADVLLYELQKSRLERLRNWFEAFGDLPEPWVKASGDVDGRVQLTREELAELSQELIDLVLRYARLHPDMEEPVPGGALVDIQLYAFPVRLFDGP